MDAHMQHWYKLIERAKWAPTPHNTQSYHLHVVNGSSAYVVANLASTIPATDPQGQFLYVGLGVFYETMRLVAADMGYVLQFDASLTDYTQDGYKTLGKLTVVAGQTSADIDPLLIERRRTSRLPFDGQPVPQELQGSLTAEAEQYGHVLGFSDMTEDIQAVLAFNTKILFYDLAHTALRRELITWVRWTKKGYSRHRDGFSIAALNQSPTTMWLFLHCPWLIKVPFMGTRIKRTYEQAISGVGTIGWLKGPFVSKQEWVNAGVILMRLWLKATEYGLYMHPFGSVITNDDARSWALQKLRLQEEAGEMCWLLFRIGKGPEPARSLRHKTEEYFV